MKRVLITGARGFIGRHCMGFLKERGYEVHAVSSLLHSKLESDIHWHSVDLLSSAETKRLFQTVQPTHLMHLAWCTGKERYWESPENELWVRASVDMLQHFGTYGGVRAVVAGTCVEYGEAGAFLDESTPACPVSVYAKAKHHLHELSDVVAERYDFSLVWGRIFHVYGPYEPIFRLVPSAIQSILQGNPAHCRRGSQVRDYLYVVDAAEALVRLLDSGLAGTFNVASGRAIEIRTFVNKIAGLLEKPDLVYFEPEPAPAPEADILTADVSRVQGLLGWSARHDLTAGLTKTIAWWKAKFGGA